MTPCLGAGDEPEILQGGRREKSRLSGKRSVVRPFRWTRERVALLGTAPDAVIGRQLRVAAWSVRRARRSRAIPAFQPQSPRVDWTAEKIALLGTAPDALVAAELGVHCSTVITKRTRLGIEAYSPTGPPVGYFGLWSEKALSQLGKMTDKALGRRFGIARHTVLERRLRLGIAPYGRSWSPFKWTAESIQQLGTRPDPVVARRLNISPRTVGDKRRTLGIAPSRRARSYEWTEGMIRMLGTKSDVELARQFGIHRKAVHRRRRALGIPVATQEVVRSSGDVERAERKRSDRRGAKRKSAGTLDSSHRASSSTSARAREVQCRGEGTSR